ncbi:alpha/beta hydrolase [Paenibacillus sp. RC67]|uniref:alpha/beta hydrolase family protein n=1 Tax=Paenibacillus sp. RC67 TaxID=3039392 RepID=UPI0024AC87CA|nr:alpha/beta hydrolase [Paenibacillus sp. RC67]
MRSIVLSPWWSIALLILLVVGGAGCSRIIDDGASLSVESREPEQNPLRTGVIQLRYLQNDPNQPYYVYKPASAKQDSPMFVTVHGTSRDAKLHAEKFAPFADAYGVVLIAPLFSEERAPNYQQLGGKGKQVRADRQLDLIVEETGRITSASTKQLYLFGYSGGGQFAHRYAMAHPERIARLVVGAAGWYTFPDRSLSYPQGIREGIPDMPDLLLDPMKFLSIPTLVLVGERDTNHGDALEQSPDIDAQQGGNRVERGQRWVEAMNEAAKSKALTNVFLFKLIPNSAHNFAQCMDRGRMGTSVFEFLFKE